ncbi:MAG: hypothetical protein RBT76_08070 [candidate division Zixibacteria bacterium]|jgi:uncharacterized membrane protein|nr:hypothetical protein [candidate division Zixibacteria bacterium]
MNAAHLHLIFNHVPVIATLFGCGFLLVGLLARKDTLIRSAFVVFIVAAVTTVPAFVSGDGAEDLIERLPGIDEKYIHAHEEAGEKALVVMIAVGVLAGAGLWVFRFMNRLRITAAVIILLASIAAAGWMAYTANLGGEIRHPEIRQDFVPPPLTPDAG